MKSDSLRGHSEGLRTTCLRLETGTFGSHALKHPEVLHHKWLYQKGVNYGFANTNAFSLDQVEVDQDHLHC